LHRANHYILFIKILQDDEGLGEDEEEEAPATGTANRRKRLKRRVTLTDVLDTSEKKEVLYNPRRLKHQESIKRRAPVTKPNATARKLEAARQKAIDNGEIVLKPESTDSLRNRIRARLSLITSISLEVVPVEEESEASSPSKPKGVPMMGMGGPKLDMGAVMAQRGALKKTSQSSEDEKPASKPAGGPPKGGINFGDMMTNRANLKPTGK
jgi:hypothetical protein